MLYLLIYNEMLSTKQQYLKNLNPRRIATHLNKIKGIRTLINHANRDKEIKANINIKYKAGRGMT